MHGFAISRSFSNLPKSIKIYPKSAHSLKKHMTNQKGNKSLSKDPYMRLPKGPLDVQIEARCSPKTVPSSAKNCSSPM